MGSKIICVYIFIYISKRPIWKSEHTYQQGSVSEGSEEKGSGASSTTVQSPWAWAPRCLAKEPPAWTPQKLPGAGWSAAKKSSWAPRSHLQTNREPSNLLHWLGPGPVKTSLEAHVDKIGTCENKLRDIWQDWNYNVLYWYSLSPTRLPQYLFLTTEKYGTAMLCWSPHLSGWWQ